MELYSYKYTLLSKITNTYNASSLFQKNSPQNHDYVQTYCNDLKNPFHFACRKWYL